MTDTATETQDGLAEPCRDCRAPLVPGQRYCLYCGTRRPDARMEFMDVLVQDVAGPSIPAPPLPPATAVAAAGAPREPGVNGWLRQNTPILALTGLILGTLLIGLLIGHWATSSDATQPAAAKAAAPTVVRVEGGGTTTAAADTTATDDTSAVADPTKDKAKDKASAKEQDDSAKAPEAAAPPADAVSADSLPEGAAKDKAIEQAAKKGQPISTGNGELPPTDSKAPAGGTDFETIG